MGIRLIEDEPEGIDTVLGFLLAVPFLVALFIVYLITRPFRNRKSDKVKARVVGSKFARSSIERIIADNKDLFDRLARG